MNALLLSQTFGDWLDGTFASFDYGIFEFFGSIQSDALTFFAKVFTSFGETMYTVLFAVLALILCFFRRTRKTGLCLLFAIIIGTLLVNVLIKPMTLRIRPYNTLQEDSAFWGWYVNAGMLSESDYCFPSGHTNAVMEISAALCVCAFSERKKSRLCRYVFWVFPVIGLATACSRVYLMVHYPTDVLAGIITGVFAGITGCLAGFAVNKLIERKVAPAREKRARKAGCAKPPEGLAAVTENETAEAKPEKEGGRGAFARLAKSKAAANGLIALAWCCIFAVGLFRTFTSGGADALRCAYDIDYDCQNEASTGSAYPPIDGEYYCKIHWKELSGIQVSLLRDLAPIRVCVSKHLPYRIAVPPRGALSQSEIVLLLRCYDELAAYRSGSLNRLR